MGSHHCDRVLADIDLKELAKTPPKDKVIYCHCGSGRLCLGAAEVLKKQGDDVRPLKQSFKDLIEPGFLKADR
ncbi:MAG TPA: rhodanese-like domain-containing protein [Gemmataceae bacterium]|nr:rhodanese-like domain-containing protein [Gemmataceae bacterium]